MGLTGCRGQRIVDRDGWRLRFASRRCLTRAFIELAPIAHALRARRVVLDSELVCLGTDGKRDYHALRPSSSGAWCSVHVIVDLLYLNSRAMRLSELLAVG
jgi:ATP-dependent DNA ligase